MLARREHSQREMQQKLQQKGFEKDDISEILEEFESKDWQSDARFAESYIRSRVHKGFGPVKIQFELRERGVDTGIGCLVEEMPDWDALLSKLHQKKYGNEVPADMKERGKWMRFFQHKGFTSDMIRRLFNRLDLESKSAM